MLLTCRVLMRTPSSSASFLPRARPLLLRTAAALSSHARAGEHGLHSRQRQLQAEAWTHPETYWANAANDVHWIKAPTKVEKERKRERRGKRANELTREKRGNELTRAREMTMETGIGIGIGIYIDEVEGRRGRDAMTERKRRKGG